MLLLVLVDYKLIWSLRASWIIEVRNSVWFQGAAFQSSPVSQPLKKGNRVLSVGYFANIRANSQSTQLIRQARKHARPPPEADVVVVDVGVLGVVWCFVGECLYAPSSTTKVKMHGKQQQKRAFKVAATLSVCMLLSGHTQCRTGHFPTPPVHAPISA